MKVRVFTSNPEFEAALQGRSKFELSIGDPSTLSRTVLVEDAINYLDSAGMDEASFKKGLRRLKNACAPRRWGVIDTAGLVEDPALLFHDDAADYVSPALAAQGLASMRMKRVLEYALSSAASTDASTCEDASAEGPPKKSTAFAGWKSVKPGCLRDFYFLYIAPDNQGALKNQIGERRFNELRDRLIGFLSQNLATSDALLWMRNEASLLFLVPTEEECSSRVVGACLRVLLNLPLTTYEQFGMAIPLPLVFALHRGSTHFQVPGNTGTVVSEDVNFIFHLGCKKAEPDRLSISKDAAQAIPSQFQSAFVRAGSFEGKDILHSRRFL